MIKLAKIYYQIEIIFRKKGNDMRDYCYRKNFVYHSEIDEAIKDMNMSFQRDTGNLPEECFYSIKFTNEGKK